MRKAGLNLIYVYKMDVLRKKKLLCALPEEEKCEPTSCV